MPFRVQVSALKTLNLDNPMFKKIKSQLGMEVHYTLGKDGNYRYYVGGFATAGEAADAVKKLKSIGVDGMRKARELFY